MTFRNLVFLATIAFSIPPAWAQALEADAIKQYIVGSWGQTNDDGVPECVRHPQVISGLPDGAYILFSGPPIRLVEPPRPLRENEPPYVLTADAEGKLAAPQIAQQFLMPNTDTLVTRPWRATGVATEFKRCSPAASE